MHRLSLVIPFLLLSACSVQPRADLLVQPVDEALITDEADGTDIDADAPFLEERRRIEEQQAASRAAIAAQIAPGTPYLIENPAAALLCAQMPTPDGRFPVADTYAHLPTLGQLLTAIDCGPARVRELPTVDAKGRYTAKGSLILLAPPSWMLRVTLEDIGYRCTKNIPALDCLQWTLVGSPDVAWLAELVPFVGEMKGESR